MNPVVVIMRCVALLLLAAMMSACASKKANEPAELVDFDETVKIKKLWSTGVGDGQGDVRAMLLPAIHDGVVYIASVDGEVEARELLSGDRRWIIEIDASLASGVAVANGRVFIGTEAGELVALDAGDGAYLWAVELGSSVDAPPATSATAVFVQTVDGKVIALDAGTGQRLWAYDGQQPILTQRGSATPAVNGDAVFAGLDNGKLVALDAQTGQIRWEGRVAVPQGRSEIDRMVDVDGQPLVSGSRVYAVSLQGNLVAFNAAAGRPEWRFPASSSVALSEGFGNIYLVEANGTVKALDPERVLQRWEQGALSWRGLTAAVPLSSYLLVGDREGYVHVLSQVDGSFAARFKLDGDGVAVPAVTADDVAVMYGNSGKLMVFRLLSRD
ncbi:MAG: outer membrane protein assembly factor BamB [Gammaproteobacteria bacterium]|nr:MAG: outer membrane protein assembly factor BamB [Gammaproteobacteria bacterium]